MAGEAGFTWRQIVAFYYPGMTLAEMDYKRNPLQALDALPSNLGRARPRPTPKPTPGPLPALAPGRVLRPRGAGLEEFRAQRPGRAFHRRRHQGHDRPRRAG